MRKVIATINMTLDGFCDHTSLLADDEIRRSADQAHEIANFEYYTADKVIWRENFPSFRPVLCNSPETCINTL